MMAHVAEASEANGRVLMLIEAGSLDVAVAAETASRFAAAFNAEIETVFVNTDVLERAQSLPVAAIAGHSGTAGEALERAGALHSLIQARQLREVSDAGRRLGVPVFHTSVAGEAIDQLDGLCLSRGPWNVVVLSRPASEETAHTANAIFANVSGATGIVGVPQRCENPTGPIAIVVEDGERLPAMLRAASRLKGLCGRVHVILAADRRKELQDLETHVRLVTSNHQGLVIEPPQPILGVAGVHDEALRALKTSFVVARLGGALLPTPKALARSIAVARSPFLLVR